MQAAFRLMPSLAVLVGCSTPPNSANRAVQTPGASTLPQAVSPTHLDRLVQLSRSADRAEWWPAVQELGRIAQADDVLRDEIWQRAKVNTLGMKFVALPPGTFIMGPDTHRIFTPSPAHTVTITHSFLMAVTEVTNSQFEQLSPKFEREPTYSPDPDSPAVRVSWDDANRFCELLSEREGPVYRLPTEAEWEYACRAGSTTTYCFGDDPSDLHEYAWCNYRNGRASPVAMLKPNDWGLYDMHGNAWEWVSDWFSYSYGRQWQQRDVAEFDPTGPAHGWTHVLRGGGWQVRGDWCLTSTLRIPKPIFNRKPFTRGVGLRETVGFRVVREID